MYVKVAVLPILKEMILSSIFILHCQQDKKTRVFGEIRFLNGDFWPAYNKKTGFLGKTRFFDDWTAQKGNVWLSSGQF
ncbi:hypothetical protein U27_05869 [Candidatus Vecturithrix granuli]|uniref:Uncharacterized protein n=1 Tax=Vecturithrix granuli TaxID=1499967 RepID=A0A081C2T9_VECG1|nr:hypothetical protein U27_05869 [Candidatus Vecturithrix granuli]